MSTLVTKCIVVCALLVQSSRAIFVKNEFGDRVIVMTSEGNSAYFVYGNAAADTNFSFFHLGISKTKDIGNDPIEYLVVSAIYWSDIIENADKIYKRERDDCGTALRQSDLKKYKEALTKLPNAVIRIIPDPKMPTRPLAILPEKELKEFLLKEHQAKAKPLIQEAGQLLPQKVHMPGCVADICAGYTSPEQ